jgi:sugar phosphate isomerase/epimerase
MTWRTGASTGCCIDTPIIDVIRAVAEAGIDAIEIGTPPRHFDVWQRPQVAAVRRALQHTGITPLAIHAPFGGLLDLSDPNPHHRGAAIGAILTAAEVLQQLGGRLVVVHATDVPRTVPDAAQRLDDAAAALRTVQRACARMDMTLALETPLGHLIGGSPEEFSFLLDAAGPETRVCLDTGHTTLSRQWDTFATLAAHRVVHVHAHDHRGTYDDHLPPGEGIIDWAAIHRSLCTIRFEGSIVLELGCPHEPLPSYFGRAYRRLGELLARETTRTGVN